MSGPLPHYITPHFFRHEMSGPGLYPPLPEVTGYAHLLSMAPGIGPGGYGTWDRPTVAFVSRRVRTPHADADAG